jgi:hypothetical protein
MIPLAQKLENFISCIFIIYLLVSFTPAIIEKYSFIQNEVEYIQTLSNESVFDFISSFFNSPINYEPLDNLYDNVKVYFTTLWNMVKMTKRDLDFNESS